MKLSFTFTSIDEIEKIATEMIDAYPLDVTLAVGETERGNPKPQRLPYAKTDDELTVHDLALYEAGRLHVYLVCNKAGFYPLEQIANTMQLDIHKLQAIKHIWDSGEIVERRDAIVEILREEARQEFQKEQGGNL